MTTQKQRVLAWLQNQSSVCVSDLPVELGYTMRNRIHELRADGVEIIGERCTAHNHRGPILAYRLAQPVQAVLAL
jgi:Helix-turn-helix domain